MSDFSGCSLCLPLIRFAACCALTVSGEGVPSAAAGGCFLAGLMGEVLGFATGLALAAVRFFFSSESPSPSASWEGRAGHKLNTETIYEHGN